MFGIPTFVTVLALFFSVGAAYAEEHAFSSLRIVTTKGVVTFKVEVARTHQEQARGLMFRETLSDDHGMIFLYDQPRVIRMWMKNTPISLDMIFIDQFGRVRHIHENAQPYDETVIASPQAVVAVLEVGAGVVMRNTIRIGDHVEMESQQ